MARPENVQIEGPAEKVIPIADPEAETVGSPGSVTKRPFVLDKQRGSGGGNMPLMLMVLGAVIIFGIGMLAFLSSKGTTKKKTAADAAKPNLGRVTGPTAPGDLIPSDKVKPSLAAISCYVFYWAVDWPGLSAALTTCIVTALSSAGASRQKQMLRFFGATAGGILAFVAQIFILPRVQSIGGFTLALAGAAFCATRVFTSSPRIAYAGRQMALSYELVHLSDPRYNVGLTQVRDRVFGIFLGLIAMWLIFDRLWTRPAAPTMTHLFDDTLELIAELPACGSLELAASVTRQRDTINRNFDKIRDLADAVLLEFRRERDYDLTARSRIRSWQPLIRVIFMLRIAILRRGLIEETGADDPRVAEAIAVSSCVLREVRGMTTIDVSRTPDPPLAACVVPIPHAGVNEHPIARIAISLTTLSAYLREDVLLDLFS